MDDIDPKLLKVVALAKQGIGGEKEVALRMVKKICEANGFDFDKVMSGDEAPREFDYWTKVRSRDEMRICIQVVARFATTPEHPDVRGGYSSYSRETHLRYTTTVPLHIETLNAMDAYLKAYRREKKNMLRNLADAFTIKHNLYSQFDEVSDEPSKPETDEERRDRWRKANLVEAMIEDVKVTKQIGDGTS